MAGCLGCYVVGGVCSPCSGPHTWWEGAGEGPLPSAWGALWGGVVPALSTCICTCPSGLLACTWRSLDVVSLPAGICLLCSTRGLTKTSWQGISLWRGLWVCAVAVVVGCMGMAESRILALLSGEGLVSPCWWAGSPWLATCRVCFDPNCPAWSLCLGDGARWEEGVCGACTGGQALAWTCHLQACCPLQCSSHVLTLSLVSAPLPPRLPSTTLCPMCLPYSLLCGTYRPSPFACASACRLCIYPEKNGSVPYLM